MLSAVQKEEWQRVWALCDADPMLKEIREVSDKQIKRPSVPQKGLKLYLYQAGVNIHPGVIIGLAIASGALVGAIAASVLPLFFAVICFFVGATIPFSWLEGRVLKRASVFTLDYSTVLLATASSVRVGMTVDAALERATKQLPDDSAVKQEIHLFLQKIKQGIPKEIAIEEFAASIRQPDLQLFRVAYILATEVGGRFAPTLTRLAEVSQDREQLIHHAQTSTATMRMTANVLLVIAPGLQYMLSLRTKDYWDIILEDSMANMMASTGVIIILFGYIVLRKMSKFKP